MARKKEERDSSGKGRRVPNKGRKYHQNGSGQEDAEIIKSQLATVGLTLRPVPGDGNCLFRALGDQLDGHMGNHHRHRQDTVNYMREHREDFQPFVEDDVPFEKHVSSLAQPGTYAGNDAIVAFARLHQVTVVIHQPNAPLWQIKGWDESDITSTSNSTKNKKVKKYQSTHCQSGQQLHIAYHGGDHYDSVRRIGDNSHTPANIRMEGDSTEASLGKDNHDSHQKYDFNSLPVDEEEITDRLDMEDIEREAMSRSGCTDITIVRELLFNNCGDLEAAVEDLLALTTAAPLCSGQTEQDPVTQTSSSVSSRSASPSNSSPPPPSQLPAGRRKNTGNRKQMEKIRKQERKRASEERKKQTPTAGSNDSVDDILVIRKVLCLNI